MPKLFCQYCGGENQYATASNKPKFCSCCGVDLKTGKAPAKPKPNTSSTGSPKNVKEQIAQMMHNQAEEEPEVIEPQADAFNRGVTIEGGAPRRMTIGDVQTSSGPPKRMPKRERANRSLQEKRSDAIKLAKGFGSSRKRDNEVG